MSDRDNGINALALYKDVSLIPSTSALVEHFDKVNPGLVEIWGRMFRSAKQSLLKEEFRELAKFRGMSFPTRAEINQAFLDAGATIETGRILKDVAVETAQDVLGAVKWSAVGGLLLVAGAAFYLLGTAPGRDLLKHFIPVPKG